jgi:hypothetical protein
LPPQGQMRKRSGFTHLTGEPVLRVLLPINARSSMLSKPNARHTVRLTHAEALTVGGLCATIPGVRPIPPPGHRLGLATAARRFLLYCQNMLILYAQLAPRSSPLAVRGGFHFWGRRSDQVPGTCELF